ncbi:MAG: hypothetical protein ABGY95_06105, partial [Rubritalea sp.]
MYLKSKNLEKLKVFICMGLVATMFTSCTSGPGNASGAISSTDYVTPPESTYKKIKFQATAIGTVSGAALGGGIAYLSGASEEGIIAAAVAGGVAGGVTGHQVGKKQVNNVKAEAGENKELASSIKDLETTNRQLASYNKGLRSKIANM